MNYRGKLDTYGWGLVAGIGTEIVIEVGIGNGVLL